MVENRRDWKLERLQRWCEEWALEQVLAADGEGLAGGRREGGSLLPFPRPVVMLHPGCVALLPPIGLGDPPLYILVLGERGGDARWVVPFGRFREPATPGEMLSGLSSEALRVLCFWNARDCTERTVPRGWVLEELAMEEQGRFLHALVVVRRTGALPASMARDGGAAVIHPDDPRRIYLHRARQQVSRTLTGSKGLYQIMPPQRKRAAEDPPEWPP
jgi:hypothetical protein